MYRAVGLAAQRAGQSPAEVAGDVDISFADGGRRVLLDGEDVSEAIRTPEVSELASQAAALPAVREAMVERQRALVRDGDWVAEGRDIGTVVAPDAEVKVFLDASPEERARRRAEQIGGDYEAILAEQRVRDERDSTREHSPLTAAEDAEVIDTTGLTPDEVVDQIVKLVLAGGSRVSMATRLRIQSHWCARLGSPLYADLLERAAADAERGGPVARVLAGHEDDPAGSMLAGRLVGSVNRLVLEGTLPSWEDADPWEIFSAALENPRIAELIDRPVQTNEPGRTAALIGGFLLFARETGLPLRLLEIGASAGLNLRWDRYRYELGDARWGPEDSPAVIRPVVNGAPPPLDGEVEIAERRGCDRRPNDPASEEGRLTLLTYCWPDQAARVRLLRGALDIAREVPVTVDEAGAGDWLAKQLAGPVDGVATVVFHSIVWQYIPHEERDRIRATLAEAGERATARAPLAWLRMEPGGEQTELRLTTWPGGDERLLAAAGFHGSPLRWLA
jgi:cytidylate kinase